MSLSGAAPGGKPRRLGLYLPFVLLAALILAWSGGWLWLRGETQRRLDGTAASLRAHGWKASWSAASLGGYPFRLDLDLKDLRIADPSGWSVTLPSLRSEAYVFAPTRWLLATANGLTFSRPGVAPVTISAPLLRASVNSWDERPPRISFVGDDLSFTGPPDAFPLASAKSGQFYTRAGPDDQGALLLEVGGGRAAPGTALDRIAGGGSISLTLDAILSHAGALAAPDWRSAASAWSRAGGQLSLQRLAFAAGPTTLEAHAGAFTIDAGGRLAGRADASLTASGASAASALSFKDGVALLGGASLGPSPRAY